MNLKYRLIYEDTYIPCSGWSSDLKGLEKYLVNRPDFVRKIIIVNNLRPTKMVPLNDLFVPVLLEALDVAIRHEPTNAFRDLKELLEQVKEQEDNGVTCAPCPNCKGLDTVEGTQPGEHHCMGCGTNFDEDNLTTDDLLKPEPMVEVFDGRCCYLAPESETTRFDEFEAAADTAEKGEDVDTDDGSMTMSSSELLQLLITRAEEKEKG